MKTISIRRPFFLLPVKATIVLVICWVVFQAMPLLPAYIVTEPRSIAQWATMLSRPEAGPMRFAVLVFGSMIYGLLRVARTHPSLLIKYKRWLTTVPWNPKLALPLGPVNLIWEDLIFGFGATTLAVIDYPTLELVPVICGLFLYSIGAIGTAVAAGRTARLATYGIAVTFAALLPATYSLKLTGFLIATLIALLRVTVTLTLVRLPWELQVQERADKAAALRSVEVWPLAPRVLSEPIDASNGVLASVTLGWITFCIAHQCDAYTRTGDGWKCVILICGSVSLTRLLAYAINFGAPINVFGRLATGQLIIPSYDKIWVAPVMVFTAATSTFAACLAASVALPAATAFAVGVAFAIALNMGPTRRNWQMTGHHRILFRPEQNQSRSTWRISPTK